MRLHDDHHLRHEPLTEKATKMTAIASTISSTLRILPRAALIGLMLAAPALAVPSLTSQNDRVVEAPAHKNSGAGLVLLMSLRRA